MKRLYQTGSVALITVSALVSIFFLTDRKVYAYGDPLCDSNKDGVSECSPGQACTKIDATITYVCSDVSTACPAACPQGKVCKNYLLSGATCVEGIVIDEEGKDAGRFAPQPCNIVLADKGMDTCPTGSKCTYSGGAAFCTDSSGNLINRYDQQTGQQQSADLGIEQFLNFWNQGYAQDESAFGKFISILYRIILPAGIVIGTLYVIVSGYMLMTSQGDPQRALEAREQLTSAIMGVLFVLLGAGILRAIISTLIQGTSPGF